MLATIGTVALVGLEAHRVRLECSNTNGLPATRMVGLPDTAVRESADRVRSAVQRSGYQWPPSRVVINLSPAALPKRGAGFDLPIALAVLAASGQIDRSALDRTWALGELGLDGTARAVPGVLPVARAAAQTGVRLIVPGRAAVEAALVEGLEVVPVGDLREAVEVLRGERGPRDAEEPAPVLRDLEGDLADVRGQTVARRALELAATGGHHLLLAGPPGCGKSMIAQRLPSILPPLTIDQALEVVTVTITPIARTHWFAWREERPWRPMRRASVRRSTAVSPRTRRDAGQG